MAFSLSIITINLNNAVGLEKTIKSVISQDFIDYEYIIIDGKSTDSSLDVIEKYASRINYWVSEPDTGIYNAMNKGIMKAKGDYLLFMNSGDCFVGSNTLTSVFNKGYADDILVGDCIFDKKIKFPEKYTFYNVMTFFIPNHQSTFIKRSLFDELGLYDENLTICADWKFFLLAVFKYDKKYKALNEYVALMNPLGISGTNEGKRILKKERDEILLQYFPYFYDDYKKLHRLKRFTFNRIKKHIKWRFKNLLRG